MGQQGLGVSPSTASRCASTTARLAPALHPRRPQPRWSGGGRSWCSSVVGCSVGFRLSGCRLWVGHGRRPLSWLVGPRWLRGWMWSMSQPGAGMSQPDGCWQCRSRTWMARRTAPVKRRRWDTSITRDGPSKMTRSMSARVSPASSWPGAMTVLSSSWQMRAANVS